MFVLFIVCHVFQTPLPCKIHKSKALGDHSTSCFDLVLIRSSRTLSKDGTFCAVCLAAAVLSDNAGF